MLKHVLTGFAVVLVSTSIAIPALAGSHSCPREEDSAFFQYMMDRDPSFWKSEKVPPEFLESQDRLSAEGDGLAMCYVGIDRFYGKHRKQDFRIAADMFRRADKRFCPSVF